MTEPAPASGATGPPAGVPPLFSPAFARDPWPTFDWLQEDAPLYLDPASGMTALTRYDDCEAALRHPGLSAAGGQAGRQQRGGVPRSMLTTDGDEHAALRRPGLRLAGPGAVRALGLGLAAHLDALMEARAAAGAPADLLSGFGEPLATLAVAALFGLDDEQDVAELDRHARAVQVNLNPVPDPATAAIGRSAMGAFSRFLDGRLDVLPAGSPLAGLTADPNVDREDVVGILSLCLVGGWSPLAEVFTSVASVALDDPPLAAAALGDAGAAAALVEEVLRWHTPIPFVARQAVEPVTLPSGVVPAGAPVLLMLAAGNRDPRVFPRPHEVDPRRGPASHLALGAGPHFCLGAALIRAVVPLALGSFLAQRPIAAVAGGGVRWQPTLFPRRVVSVPVMLRGPAPGPLA